MANYDDYYELEAQEAYKQELQEVTEELNHKIEKLGLDDKIFVLNIVRKLKKYKNFFSVIRDVSK